MILNTERIESIFDIAGKDENAITRSFGAVLRKDKTLLRKLLFQATDKTFNISKELFDRSKFSFEKVSAEGRTDIEIENVVFHIIIESKIGTNEVKISQARRYAEKLEKSPSKEKIFIFLTEIGNLDIDSKLKKEFPSVRFANVSWEQTLKLLADRKQLSVNLVEEYEKYLLGGREMKIHDIDIWAVVVRGKQLRNFNQKDFYINDRKHVPIFIGKREWDKKEKKVVIRELRPVLGVLDKDSPEGKANGGNYYYRLGKKLILQEPIVKKFGQASAISLGFNDF